MFNSNRWLRLPLSYTLLLSNMSLNKIWTSRLCQMRLFLYLAVYVRWHWLPTEKSFPIHQRLRIFLAMTWTQMINRIATNFRHHYCSIFISLLENDVLLIHLEMIALLIHRFQVTRSIRVLSFGKNPFLLKTKFFKKIIYRCSDCSTNSWKTGHFILMFRFVVNEKSLNKSKMITFIV